MRKNKLVITILCVFMSMLTACGMFDNKIPELTDEQHDMVVEYATETLLHFDSQNGDKIKPSKKYEIIMDVEEEENEEVEESANEDLIVLPEEPEYIVNDEPVNNMEEDVSENATLDSLSSVDGVTISYAGYIITDDYAESDEDYFSLRAQEGCKLLVLRFVVTNTTGSDVSISMPYNNIRYKISLNGSVKNALTTILLNDLALYQNVLMPYESDELVVIGEYSENDLNAIETLKLVVKSEEDEYSIVLQ